MKVEWLRKTPITSLHLAPCSFFLSQRPHLKVLRTCSCLVHRGISSGSTGGPNPRSPRHPRLHSPCTPCTPKPL